MVEDSYKFAECLHSIHNTAAVAMLVRWMPSLPPPLQSWLADRLYDLCSSGAHNKQRCCSAQLLCVVVETLVSSQHDGRQFSEEVEGGRSVVVALWVGGGGSGSRLRFLSVSETMDYSQAF